MLYTDVISQVLDEWILFGGVVISGRRRIGDNGKETVAVGEK